MKTYKAGPMHCTKLKVYRPKSCNILPKPLEYPEKCESNYLSISNIDLDKIKPMDMAIRWDYQLPSEKQKFRMNFDPTNTAAAFNLIKHSAPNTERSVHVEHPGGVFANTNGEEGFFEKDILRRNKSYFASKLEKESHRFCQCKNLTADRALSAERRNLLPQNINRCSSSPNISNQCNPNKKFIPQKDVSNRPKTSKPSSNESRIRTFLYSEKVFQNGNEMNRTDMLKYEHKSSSRDSRSDSSGVHSAVECCSRQSSSKSNAKKPNVFNIPKPRHPYTKKNYVIDTLAPPFSCWKGGAGQGGYPDYWRLSSVYQQAYKPIHQRKRPLLETVYK